jgi:hypothetical protein
MNQSGECENSSVIPSFNRSIRIDFRGAKSSSDAGVLMLREIDERFNITAPPGRLSGRSEKSISSQRHLCGPDPSTGVPDGHRV